MNPSRTLSLTQLPPRIDFTLLSAPREAIKVAKLAISVSKFAQQFSIFRRREGKRLLIMCVVCCCLSKFSKQLADF